MEKKKGQTIVSLMLKIVVDTDIAYDDAASWLRIYCDSQYYLQ